MQRTPVNNIRRSERLHQNFLTGCVNMDTIVSNSNQLPIMQNVSNEVYSRAYAASLPGDNLHHSQIDVPDNDRRGKATVNLDNLRERRHNYSTNINSRLISASMSDQLLHQSANAIINDDRNDRNNLNTTITIQNPSSRPNMLISNTAGSIVNSRKTTNSAIERRRLEIQLEFARKKKEETLKFLEIQEKLELAKLNEQEEIDEDFHINPNNDCHGDYILDRERNIRSWVQNSRVVNENDDATNFENNQACANQRDYCNLGPEIDRRNKSFNNVRNENYGDQLYENRTFDRASIDNQHGSRTYPQGSSNIQHQHIQRQEQSRVNNIENWITRQAVNKELPKFSGNPLEWPQFITQYKTTTDLCKLSNIENQMRLQKSLTGQALAAVQPLLIYPNNVNRVIEILQKRFGRTDFIIHLLLERVRNFPLIKEDKLSSLIEFFDIFSNMVYTLESLDKEDHMRNPILYQEILNKLPLRHKLDFAQHLDDIQTTIPPISTLHTWLERKVSAANHLMIPSNISKFSDHDKIDKQSKGKAMTFSITDNRPTEFVCLFCSEKGHTLNFCSKFKKIDVNDRWDFVTKNRFCFSCLKGKHSVKFCKKRKSCTIINCTKVHHPLLHKSSDDVRPSTVHTVAVKPTNCHVYNSNYALLKIMPIILKGPNCELKTFALFDEGSTVSLIDSNLAYQLGLEGPKKHLKLQWTNNQFNEQKDSQVVSVSIKGNNEYSDTFYTLRHVKTVNDLSLPTQSVDIELLSQKYPYLAPFKDNSYVDGQPMLLIGQDNWPIIVSRKITHGLWDGPTASKTLLGWVVHGNISNKTVTKNHLSFHVTEDDSSYNDKDDLNMLQDLIREQWNWDISGVTCLETDLCCSVDDKRCLDIFNDTIKKVGDKFQCGLLWKFDNINLTDSKTTALKRLKCLENKMDKNAAYASSYVAKMNDYISKGYIKKVFDDELKSNSRIWYLPHFGVVNPNKPDKLRIVFDAAAKSNGYSLNDYLLTGPDLYNSLPTILMNFRTHKIAFIGDIKEMFLQILMKSEDKAAQRILWRGMQRDSGPETYEIQVVFFGATCSPSIAQAVMTRNAKDHIEEFPLVYREVNENHYMDDYLSGADTEEDAISLIKDVCHVHKLGGFQICNWVSNSEDVLQRIDNNLKADLAKKDFDFDASKERVLGVWWNFAEDVFVFNLKFSKVDQRIFSDEKRPTKRDILKMVMSIFDPLGFISNVIIVGKILMQKIWESGINWDDPIMDYQYTIWKSWCENFKNISDLKIPRLLTTLPKLESNIQLHIFCDASEYAYATVAYLRFEHKGEMQCSIINSKARVAPVKPLSIPRLELQAALLGARLGFSIKRDIRLNINSVHYWSDSKIVLYWIKSSSKRYKTFVAQRIGEIHDLCDPTCWKYIPSKLNTADDATKFKKLDFSHNSLWLKGPEFLGKSISEWPPSTTGNLIFDNDNIEELKSEFVNVVVETKSFEIIPDVSRFSNWSRFIRSIAWCLRAVNIFKHRTDIYNNSFELIPEDISKAEILVWKKVQFDSYKLEIETLKSNKRIPKSSPLYPFSCFLDNGGIIRIKGRLNNADHVNSDFKAPIILNHKHEIVQLLVKFFHNQNNHIGTETIISDLRKKFWITKLRSIVKRCQYQCQYCRNIKAKPQVPIMGQLPICRIEKSTRPFLKCGIDYFGPITITVGRRHEKRYGAIFTCMSMRAIHIEIANDLSFNSFMHVFRQFGSRRGFPEEIYSDNGSNFRKASKEIQEAMLTWPKDDLTKFCTMRQCKWYFNPPVSPHMGGVWERLIQSIKRHLNFVLLNRNPMEYVLRTVLCEIEFIINSRPITFNSSDSQDACALTPNDLLIGPIVNNFPILNSNDKDLTLISMWQASQRLADIFWKRWVAEYLPCVLQSKKWSKESKNISVGDIVIIVDAENPRNCWPKGRVVKTFQARDGVIRVADIDTISGIFRRSVAKLIKLDILDKL